MKRTARFVADVVRRAVRGFVLRAVEGVLREALRRAQFVKTPAVAPVQERPTHASHPNCRCAPLPYAQSFFAPISQDPPPKVRRIWVGDEQIWPEVRKPADDTDLEDWMLE